MMETALQWFYGNSTDVKNIESFDILENVFGIAMLKTPDVIKKEPELSTLEAEDKDDWSLFCQKDSTSRYFIIKILKCCFLFYPIYCISKRVLP